MTTFEFVSLLLAQLGIYHSIMSQYIKDRNKSMEKIEVTIQTHKQKLSEMKEDKKQQGEKLTDDNQQELSKLEEETEINKEEYGKKTKRPIQFIHITVMIVAVFISFSPLFTLSQVENILKSIPAYVFIKQYMPNGILLLNVGILVYYRHQLKKLNENLIKIKDGYKKILANEKDIEQTYKKNKK